MPDLQLDYEAVQEMEAALTQTAEWLGEVASHMRRMAEVIDAGALVHAQGQRWSETLRGRMFNGLINAQATLEELAKDVAGALGDVQAGDTEGSQLFG
jgi:hypothetical protein